MGLGSSNYWIGINAVLQRQPLAKPILRPLSDLTREIEHNGKKFVPIVELCKLYESDQITYIEIKGSNNLIGLRYFDKDGTDCVFAYHIKYGAFAVHTVQDELFHIVYNQLELFQKLFECHIDVFGLIERGKAIDINRLRHESRYEKLKSKNFPNFCNSY